MAEKKLKMTWHYYVMAFGALMALMAMSLSAWNAAISAIAFVIMTHPGLQLKMPTRVLFLAVFSVLFYSAFPDASVVQEIMASTKENS